MNSLQENLILLLEKKLANLKKCLQVMNEKTLVLMSNNLPRLEKSLEEETLLLNELMELDSSINELLKGTDTAGNIGCKKSLEVCFSTMGLQSSAGLQTLCDSLEETGDGIQRAMCKNAALIANGSQFTSAMLEVVCPAKTYKASGGGPEVPATVIVSVSC